MNGTSAFPWLNLLGSGSGMVSGFASGSSEMAYVVEALMQLFGR